MARQSIRNKTIRLADFVKPGVHPALIEDVEFYNCTLEGPAVIIPVDIVSFSDNELTDATLWPIAGGRPYDGGIGARRCVFDECKFVGVGIATTPAFIERFLATARPPAPTEE